MTTVWHQNVNVVTPWNATYAFPSQATQSRKQIVKVIPTTGTTYNPDSGSNRVIFNYPSDGYWNPMNSAISFKLRFLDSSNTAETVVRGLIKENAGVLNARTTADVAVNWNSYASTAKYAVLHLPSGDVECSVAASNASPSVLTISECTLTGDEIEALIGTGGTAPISIYPNETRLQPEGVHGLIYRYRAIYGGSPLEDIPEYAKLARALIEAGIAYGHSSTAGALMDGTYRSFTQDNVNNVASGSLPSQQDLMAVGPASLLSMARDEDGYRHYTFNLFAGLTRSSKLIPLKWMAAQFSIELELHRAASALLSTSSSARYEISDVCWIMELHEFDSMYDMTFKQGMDTMGIPIKFTSYSHQQKPLTSSSDYSLMERARSLKSALAIVADSSATTDPRQDSNVMYHNVANYRASGSFTAGGTACRITGYQWRIGGRYMPAQKVECRYGAAEAYLELAKTINTLGDYTFSGRIQPHEWSSSISAKQTAGEKFIIACEFENTDVFPNTISGLNAENQSDINLFIETSSASVAPGKTLHVFTARDNLLIVRNGHLVDLIM
jgi:hypothetical protein